MPVNPPDERDVGFFATHATWSYDPKCETSEAGRRRSALELAWAERWLWRQPGVSVRWRPDPCPDGAGVKGRPRYAVRVAVPGRRALTLDAIGLDPRLRLRDPYTRVVVALLAQNLLAQANNPDAAEGHTGG